MMNRSEVLSCFLTPAFLATTLMAGDVFAASADPKYAHDATEKEISQAFANDRRNRLDAAKLAQKPKLNRIPLHPVEDTAQFRYVLMSSQEPSDEIVNLRHTIAQNLPPDVKLVILGDTSETAAIKAEYAPFLSADRLIVASDSDTSGGLWARDSFPVPVYETPARGGASAVSLVAAHYYRDFSSWDAIANAVGDRDMQKVGFTFVGGNILSDQDGNCFSVNSYRLFTATEADLKASYGCKTVHLMPHVRGLGDVDEVLKPLAGKKMLTNSVEYKTDLESWGYQVVLVPALPETYRTYINSLVVGQTVFMPSYGVPEDQQAQAVYESLGYHVVTIASNDLSDDMHGSIHCQTMAYPEMGLAQLLEALHAHLSN